MKKMLSILFVLLGIFAFTACNGDNSLPTVTSIALSNVADSTTVLAAPKYTVGNLVVTATYSNGSTATLAAYTVDTSKVTSATEPGTYPVSVTAEGITESYNVTVSADTLTSISVDSSTVDRFIPLYKASTWSYANLVVTGIYNNDSNCTATLTEYTVNSTEVTKATTDGKKTVTVSVADSTIDPVEFEVYVIDQNIDTSSIKVYYNGADYNLEDGAELSELTAYEASLFDSSKLVITAEISGADEDEDPYVIPADDYEIDETDLKELLAYDPEDEVSEDKQELLITILPNLTTAYDKTVSITIVPENSVKYDVEYAGIDRIITVAEAQAEGGYSLDNLYLVIDYADGWQETLYNTSRNNLYATDTETVLAQIETGVVNTYYVPLQDTTRSTRTFTMPVDVISATITGFELNSEDLFKYVDGFTASEYVPTGLTITINFDGEDPVTYNYSDSSALFDVDYDAVNKAKSTGNYDVVVSVEGCDDQSFAVTYVDTREKLYNYLVLNYEKPVTSVADYDDGVVSFLRTESTSYTAGSTSGSGAFTTTGTNVVAFSNVETETVDYAANESGTRVSTHTVSGNGTINGTFTLNSVAYVVEDLAYSYKASVAGDFDDSVTIDYTSYTISGFTTFTANGSPIKTTNNAQTIAVANIVKALTGITGTDTTNYSFSETNPYSNIEESTFTYNGLEADYQRNMELTGTFEYVGTITSAKGLVAKTVSDVTISQNGVSQRIVIGYDSSLEETNSVRLGSSDVTELFNSLVKNDPSDYDSTITTTLKNWGWKQD